MRKDFRVENLREEIEKIYDDFEKEQKRKKQEAQTHEPQDCYMIFNGTNLGLVKAGKLVDNLDAMSGYQAYQAKKYQDVVDRGPIPEGKYDALQKERQTITPFDAGVGLVAGALNINYGKWKGSLPTWGMRRVWIHPDDKTNTYGRDNFSIHGGMSKGSRGCIDIPWQTDKLSTYLDGCADEKVPLYVRYKRDYW